MAPLVCPLWSNWRLVWAMSDQILQCWHHSIFYNIMSAFLGIFLERSCSHIPWDILRKEMRTMMQLFFNHDQVKAMIITLIVTSTDYRRLQYLCYKGRGDCFLLLQRMWVVRMHHLLYLEGSDWWMWSLSCMVHSTLFGLCCNNSTSIAWHDRGS